MSSKQPFLDRYQQNRDYLLSLIALSHEMSIYCVWFSLTKKLKRFFFFQERFLFANRSQVMKKKKAPFSHLSRKMKNSSYEKSISFWPTGRKNPSGVLFISKKKKLLSLGCQQLVKSTSARTFYLYFLAYTLQAVALASSFGQARFVRNILIRPATQSVGKRHH